MSSNFKRTVLTLILLISLMNLSIIIPIQSFPITETHDNFTVTWYEISQYPFIYDISIQNLKPIKQSINITSIIDSTSFPIEELDIIGFYEWKNISHIKVIPIYDTISWWNGTHQVSEVVEVGSYEETTYNLEWKACKMQSFKRTATQYRENMGEINIPKFGSKPKDGTGNGTKWFRAIFSVPMSKRGAGWGSSGRVALDLSGAEFDPWWDITWLKRQRIDIDNSASSETFANFTVHIEVTYDADMQADFDDLRFLDSDDSTALYAQLEDKTDSNIAYVWVRVPSLTAGANPYSIYMYYGNVAASSSWSTADAWDDDYVGVWHHDETSGNVIDAMGSFDLIPQGSPDQSGTIDPDGSDLGAGAGSGDYYTHTDAAGLECGTGNWTMFALAKMSDTSTEGKVMGKSTEGGNYPLYDMACEDNTGFVKVYFRTSGAAYTLIKGNDAIFDKTTLIIGVRDVPNDDINLYINGTIDATATDNSADIQSVGNFSVLARHNVYPGKANITESRLYQGIMTAEWAEAEQLNVFTTWLTFQAEEDALYTTTNYHSTTVTAFYSTTNSGTDSGYYTSGTTAYETTTEDDTATTTVYSTTTLLSTCISVDITITVSLDETLSVDLVEYLKGASFGTITGGVVVWLFILAPVFLGIILLWRRRRR